MLLVMTKWKSFLSLNIRSMWETICDPRPSKARQNFVLKLARTPCSGIWYRTPPPPPMKSWPNLALWVLITTELPPPNWNLGRSWQFEFWLLQNTPPPPHPKLKSRQILALWVLDYYRPPPTPLTPSPKLKFRQISTVWVQLEYVETNCCILQGYHLVLAMRHNMAYCVHIFHIPCDIFISYSLFLSK